MTPLNQLNPAVADIALSSFLAFVLAMALTPIYTNLAYRFQWWKKPRQNAVTGEAAPVFHKLHAAKHKRHIPTMAGVVLLVAVAVVTLVANLDRRETWLPLATLGVFGALGLVDDMSNVFRLADKRGGLGVKTQLLALITLSLGAGYWFFVKLGYNSVYFPGVGDIGIGWAYVPLAALVIVSTSKAVSITDGLDGLAGGLLSIAFSVFSVMAYLQGNFKIAIFCGALVGVLIAYTWFNIFPARFFMGNTGSVALGAALGVVAMLTNTLLVLPIIGGVFVAEAGSSLLQIASKKVLKRKIFLSAPIHHHFEARGWPESKVTMRFWLLGAVCGSLGLVVAFAGGLI